MLFYDNLKHFKKNVALIADDISFSYGNLIEDAQKIAKEINSKNLIFLLADNDYESVTSILATEFSKSVSMLLNYNINNEILLKLINLYNPDYIFLNKSNTLKIKNFENKLNFHNYILIKNKKSFKKKINSDLFLLQSTSGSTGSPKNVRISYENIITNTNSIIQDLNIMEDDIAITTLPVSYVYGLSIINSHLKVGAKITLNKNSIFEQKFWKRLVLSKSNNFGGVPFTYEMLLKIGLKKKYFQFIRYSTIAGGHLQSKIKTKILDFYEKNNISLITMYGAAEATARMAYLPPQFSRKKNGSIGIPINKGKLVIEDDKKNILNKPYKEGEIIYKGKNVFMGYANNYKDLIKKNLNNYILRTGDTGYFDKDGFFYVVGKKSRYVKITGNRISLDEIEKIIYDYGYKNICIQKTKDKIDIYVNKKNIENKIKTYISKYTNLHLSIFNVSYIKTFPMTKNNKIDYNNEIFLNE